MPDLSSVENTLVETVAEILTTNIFSSINLYQPETIFTSNAQVWTNVSGTDQLVNVQCRLFRGFPVPNDIKIDLQNGISEISVFAVSGMSRLLPGYLSDIYVSSTVPITFTAVATGNSVTFGGTATAGQVTGIACGNGIVLPAYCIRLGNTDTPYTIAAALGAIIPDSTVTGATITIAGVNNVYTGVVSDSTVNNELAWYSQMIDIHIWSPNPESRDALGAMITLGMAQDLNLQFFDGSSSEITYYRGTWTDDAVQDTMEWHRYMRYEVPYPTVLQTTITGVLFLGINVNLVKTVGEFDYRSF